MPAVQTVARNTSCFDRPLAPKAATAAVATKLLRVAWACMTHGQAYDAHRLFATTEVVVAA